jgi:hypothetical protein
VRIRFPDGRELEAVNPATANLLHLMELKQQTKEWSEDGKGLGMRALSAMRRRSLDYQLVFEAEQKAAADEGRPMVEPDPPDDADVWTAVVLYLSRRAAGDRLSFLEAADVRMGELAMIPDPGDEGPGETDPTTPGSGGPATPEPDPGLEA